MDKEIPYAIEMIDITKRFPGIIANDHITLQLKKGEIHALLGENGNQHSCPFCSVYTRQKKESSEKMVRK